MASTASPAQTQQGLVDMIAGLKNLDPNQVITIEGKSATVAEHITQFEADLALYKKVGDTAVAHDAAVQARADAAPQIEGRLSKMRAAIKITVGRYSAGLKAFGMEPDKVRRQLTTEEQAARNAKSKATRVARHTLGPKQKEQIHGDPGATGTKGP